MQVLPMEDMLMARSYQLTIAAFADGECDQFYFQIQLTATFKTLQDTDSFVWKTNMKS